MCKGLFVTAYLVHFIDLNALKAGVVTFFKNHLADLEDHYVIKPWRICLLMSY